MQDCFDIIIIGAGIGGITASQTALTSSGTTRVLLINGEDCPPYDRPPLSKALLAGDATTADIALLPQDWQDNPRLSLRQGRTVTAIDRDGKSILLDDGERLHYATLILATGCRPRLLDPNLIDPVCRDRLFYLRSLADAQRLQAQLTATPRPRLAIVGGGFIGLEVAATARQAGCPVNVLEAGERLIGRGAPATVADFVKARHEEAGVGVHLGARLQRIAARKQALELRLEDGSLLQADIVVAGIGALPNDELARSAGLACDDGILVDAACRTSDASIFAIGDAVRLRQADGQRGERIEHWNAARQMGEVAATNACGGAARYSGIPWVWSDQYVLNLQFLGVSAAGHHHIIRGDPASARWALLEVRDDRLVAATLINQGKERRNLERLITSETPLSAAALATLGDPAASLKTLA